MTADPPNPSQHRANYVRILTMPDSSRWVYASFVDSVIAGHA